MEAYRPTPEIRQVGSPPAPADPYGVQATADAIELQLAEENEKLLKDCDKNLDKLRELVDEAEDRFNSRSF